ncbi:hypothetical protein [Bogoriella caseilytica]|uniref:DUF2178 domain-containing protein n=1 Tax=Bogoriella caseilytica TaxID=56055 RepID=A0A3N2BG16_9MICO|nr:hypothetical protein [Bogoriella caseilytica]ROR74158.1 hypothetical protein EDD31_2558 [Bogoriella caseilytica]
MRRWIYLALGCLAALITVWALDHALPETYGWLITVLYTVFVFGAGIGTHLTRRQAEKANRTAEPESVEHELAQQSAAGTFSLALVLPLGLGLYLLTQGLYVGAAISYLMVVVLLFAYWIRYAILRERVT